MFYPLASQRVWVSGPRHELIVEKTDYTTRVSSISSFAREAWQLPPHLPFSHYDLEPAEIAAAARDIRRCSWVAVRQAHHCVWELQESIRITLEVIRKSATLIEESDRVIARARTLGCTEI